MNYKIPEKAGGALRAAGDTTDACPCPAEASRGMHTVPAINVSSTYTYTAYKGGPRCTSRDKTLHALHIPGVSTYCFLIKNAGNQPVYP